MILSVWALMLRKVLCIFLCLTFLLTGICKIIPHVHAETYHFLNVFFLNEVTPVWQAKVFDQIGLKVHPLVFKFLIGNLEVFSAILLWAGSHAKKLASFFLMGITANACLTHYWLDQDFSFPLVLLGCSALVFILSFDSPPVLYPPHKYK